MCLRSVRIDSENRRNPLPPRAVNQTYTLMCRIICKEREQKTQQLRRIQYHAPEAFVAAETNFGQVAKHCMTPDVYTAAAHPLKHPPKILPVLKHVLAHTSSFSVQSTKRKTTVSYVLSVAMDQIVVGFPDV